jgi:hypothetical protein
MVNKAQKKAQIVVVLVTRSWNGKRKLTVKGTFLNRPDAEAFERRLYSKCFGDNTPDYRVLGPIQFKRLTDEIKKLTAARRATGAKKAAKTRAKNGTKSTFITCPHCGAKSKKLYSEMGGLQTRQCQKGHRFEYDKWIADRAVWGLVLTGRVANPYS